MNRPMRRAPTWAVGGCLVDELWAGTWPGDERVAKARLRTVLLAARRARPVDPASDDARAARLLELDEVRAARCVALYLAFGGEPATAAVVDALRARGVRVLLPSVRADLDLEFREHTGELVAGRLGTREPPGSSGAVPLDAAEVVVVPAVAVDRRGRRLGRGGGSYDRALARAGPGSTVVALLDASEVVDEVPTEPHDRPVDVVVTQTGVLRRAPRS